MESAHALNILVHVLAGAAALVTGLVPLLTRKGSVRHRRGGWVFAVFGGLVVVSSLTGVVVFDHPDALAAAALSVAYQYVGGLRSLSRVGAGPDRLDAAMAVGLLVGAGALMLRMGPGAPPWTPTLGYSVLGFVSMVALYDLSRHFWAATWRTHVRPIDHGLKMTGAYFAMLSAGLGNLLPALSPWSATLPSVLGTLVMIAFGVTYARRRLDRRRLAAVAA